MIFYFIKNIFTDPVTSSVIPIDNSLPEGSVLSE